MHKLKLAGPLTAIAILIGGCSNAPVKPGTRGETVKYGTTPVVDTEHDGPPLHFVDVSNIPNAVPKAEPYSKYGNPRTYNVFGKKYNVMTSSAGYKQKGIASWYGQKFHGRRTSSGEPYDVYQMTAAHKSLPLPTYATVKNLDNGREVIVKINDRGPFHDDRILDLSFAAAKKLGISDHGTGRVLVTAIDTRKSGQKPIQIAKASPKAAVKSHKEKFFVQLGAFKDKANATKLANKTTDFTKQNMKFLDTYVHQSSETRSPLYAVRVGPFENAHDAEQAKTKLARATFSTPKIIKEVMQ